MSLKAMLLCVDLGEYDADESIKELTALREAMDMEVVFSVIQKRDAPDSKYYIGEGKLAEAKEMCAVNDVEICIFDCELTGSQLRNLSDYLEIEVIDRTMLILEIFSMRRTTNEGKLQTELATLKYRLPRLTGLGTSLSRQGGGGGGGGGARRGAGESKLEYDRRYINGRIELIKQRLEQMEKRRGTVNRARQKNEVPVVALTGYTNVGKSSLLNVLTGSEILEKDMLFATLDPTARKLVLPSGQTVILVDTVGFVSRLPHNLVEAFKSTLEQAKYADVILCVCDCSSEDCMSQIQITRQVLSDIGCDMESIITVYNKRDKIDPVFHRDGLYTSTRTGEGLDLLLVAIDNALSANMLDLDAVLPYSETGLLNVAREFGRIDLEEYTAEGVHVKGKVDRKVYWRFMPYEGKDRR
ncbi:MAG: GTPase HflX [Oscillospiraceae bacterium]|nr:GTPase HflX [Oscillospiraceae bacterium]